MRHLKWDKITRINWLVSNWIFTIFFIICIYGQTQQLLTLRFFIFTIWKVMIFSQLPHESYIFIVLRNLMTTLRKLSCISVLKNRFCQSWLLGLHIHYLRNDVMFQVWGYMYHYHWDNKKERMRLWMNLLTKTR